MRNLAQGIKPNATEIQQGEGRKGLCHQKAQKGH